MGVRLLEVYSVAITTMEENGVEQEIFRPSKKKSEVWAYFGFMKDANGQLIENHLPVCKTCRRKVSAKGGNTTNLMVHLRDKHAQLYRQLKVSRNTTIMLKSVISS